MLEQIEQGGAARKIVCRADLVLRGTTRPKK